MIPKAALLIDFFRLTDAHFLLLCVNSRLYSALWMLVLERFGRWAPVTVGARLFLLGRDLLQVYALCGLGRPACLIIRP